MHYESDYIMRMIHLLRLLYEYLCGLTEAQQLRSGDDAIAEALRKLTGLSMDTVDSMPIGQIALMLGKDGESASRVYAVAELLRMRAELHARLGFPEEGREMDLRAFQMYLKLPHTPAELAEGLYPVLREYRGKFFPEMSDAECVELSSLFERGGYYADAEDAIRAQADDGLSAAFYRRILALSGEEQSRGGLPRLEILEGLSQVTE